MKKHQLIILIVLFLLCQPLNAQSLRAGFVDFKKVLEQSKVRKEINTHSKILNEQFRKYEKKQYAKINTVPFEQQRIIRNTVHEKRYSLSLALRINKNKLFAYNETIRVHIREVAKKHKLSFIFLDEHSVILVDGFTDITEEVIEKINQDG